MAEEVQGAHNKLAEEHAGNLREIYSQHWLHIRHIDNQRLSFSSFYVAFLGIGSAYIFRADGSFSSKLIFIIFGLSLSVWGFHIMVRVLLTFWFHYLELQRITPILCANERLDFEGDQTRIENRIYETERPLKWLNKAYIHLTKVGPLAFPLSLIFPSIYLIGFIVLTVMLFLLIFKMI